MVKTEFKYCIPLMLNNPDGLERRREPVIAKLRLADCDVELSSMRLYKGETLIPHQIFDVVKDGDRIVSAKIVFIVDMDQVTEKYYLYFNDYETESLEFEGIKQLTPVQKDGVKRLDTGYYILELCRGTGEGTSASKWGIRYFEAKREGKNLIANYSNAIGGFYGPFFTPSNGLVNPPEHTVVDVVTEVEGSLYCRYRFDGTIPDGLDENLRNKKFSITWEFFYDSPWFRRKYDVDGFSTVIDGMPCENLITVGDEFESGQGDLVFNRFASYGQTYFRQGDYYARILADKVKALLDMPVDKMSESLRKYRDSVGDNIYAVSWDFFWRLFCVKEGILTDDEILEHVDEIVEEAHNAVHNSERYYNVQRAKEVDVNSVPEQTIFALTANKTAEFNDQTGYCMVWYTSHPVARYQIVQRKESGWVNWGTNGENEFPELPIGTTIYTAYGRFSDWEKVADAMEKNIEVKQGMLVRL